MSVMNALRVEFFSLSEIVINFDFIRNISLSWAEKDLNN